ncbi:hypothetical protein SAMN05444008_101358 [Cnuella takakiae]|uniref:Uncharacterized protein n=1 Tax=Cnuella takakiae TaxID=1302690 RepID=A0A1M4T910_9BACT|nr:hypothetical protein [Cnuella takakiae]SHE40961.1 hypothetical protein SAMN05444008_101358 [Cnuella takakiae]
MLIAISTRTGTAAAAAAFLCSGIALPASLGSYGLNAAQSSAITRRVTEIARVFSPTDGNTTRHPPDAVGTTVQALALPVVVGMCIWANTQ